MRIDFVVAGTSANLNSKPYRFPPRGTSRSNSAPPWVAQKKTWRWAPRRLRTCSKANPSQERRTADASGLLPRRAAQQRVQEAGVAHVDFRRLHQPLACVLEPGRQTPQQESARQDVHVSPGRLLIDGNGPRQFGDMEHAAVQVREHRPETAELLGRQCNAEAGRVTAQERINEILTPGIARESRRPQGTTAENHPAPRGGLRAPLPVSVMSKPLKNTKATRPASVSDAPGPNRAKRYRGSKTGLGPRGGQPARAAPETARAASASHPTRPTRRESPTSVRGPLPRIADPPNAPSQSSAHLPPDLTCQCGLAALPRPQQCRNRGALQGFMDSLDICIAGQKDGHHS